LNSNIYNIVQVWLKIRVNASSPISLRESERCERKQRQRKDKEGQSLRESKRIRERWLLLERVNSRGHESFEGKKETDRKNMRVMKPLTLLNESEVSE